MVKSLRPGYEPPNRKQIGCDLLDKVSREVYDDILWRILRNNAKSYFIAG